VYCRSFCQRNQASRLSAALDLAARVAKLKALVFSGRPLLKDSPSTCYAPEANTSSRLRGTGRFLMTKIGFATIGQTPRSDLVPYLLERIPSRVEALEAGVLDGLTAGEMAALDRGGDGLHMVTRLRDGGSVRLAYDEALPRMQQISDGLVARGAELIVILCGADWSAVQAPVPVINPGVLFPNVIRALAANSRLGVIRPSAGQVGATARQYTQEFGLDAVVTSAFPYDDAAVDAARTAARELAAQQVTMAWLTCVGMDEDMREAVRSELGCPVILARSVLARMIGELLA
jgi:protein AroM